MKDKKTLVYFISSIATSALAVLCGVVFLIQLIRLYGAGNTPIYSRELVGKYLLPTLGVVIPFALSIIFVGIYSVLKCDAKKARIKLTNEDKYKALTNGVTLPKDNVELKKENNLRLGIRIVLLLACGAATIFMVVYTCLPDVLDGGKNPTTQVVDLLIHYSPFILMMLILAVVEFILREQSFKRSNEIIKSIRKDLPKENNTKNYSKIIWIVRGAFIACSIGLIIFGAINGEAKDVLQKAANICSECIGLG